MTHLPPAAIELRGISKAFGAVQANKDISITVRPGTIHGIIGENGAGKSTLMSILYGFYKADAGEILINGAKIDIPDSQAAIRAGIGMVFQHFKLVENFTVLENVVLGAEDGPLLKPSLARAREQLERLSADYELDVDPDALIDDISVGLAQRVEILKALYRHADILILDEPTGVLTPSEADHLFRILRHLRDEGKTIILITHKLREIMDVTDEVSVMRRGTMVASVDTAKTSPAELAELMVGRKVLLRVEKTPAKRGPLCLDVKKLRVRDSRGVERLRGVNLQLYAGEILGIAGVSGNGQSELLDVLGGLRKATGEAMLNGRALDLSRPGLGRQRRHQGIGHIPEDRHKRGLILDYFMWENSALGYHDAPDYRAPFGMLNHGKMREDASGFIKKYDIRPPVSALKAANYSGGNQQKIVIAREFEHNPDVLLIGQPTRGVDIGAIEFIHRQIIALRDQGKAILLVSVELDEIMSLSDRIAVMCDGEITGECRASETDEQALGLLMAGVRREEGADA